MKFTLRRTAVEMPEGHALVTVRQFLFGVLDGISPEDKRAWRRFWMRLANAAPDDGVEVEVKFRRASE